MNRTFFNPEETQSFNIERDVLSVFKQTQERPNQIKLGMTPSEIADFVSDHIIGVIRQQFENTKQAFINSKT